MTFFCIWSPLEVNARFSVYDSGPNFNDSVGDIGFDSFFPQVEIQYREKEEACRELMNTLKYKSALCEDLVTTFATYSDPGTNNFLLFKPRHWLTSFNLIENLLNFTD